MAAPGFPSSPPLPPTRSQIERCQRAMIGITLNQPILGMASARMALLPAPPWIDTAAVTHDGKILIDGTFFATLTEEEVRFVLAHEIMHLLLFHYDRRKDRNPLRWNKSADRWINWFLSAHCGGKGSGRLMAAPKHALFPLKPEHAGLSVEQLYDLEPEDEGNGQRPLPTAGCGIDGNADPEQDPGTADDPAAAQQRAADAVLTRAVWRGVAEATKTLAREAGDEAARALANILNPPPARVRWSQIIKRACEDAEAQAGDDDVSWQRRNRRRQDVYIPGHVTTMVNVAVIIDSSGSVPTESLAQAVAETAAIAKESATAIYLVVHDAEVQFEGWVDESVPKIAAAIIGRGGTVFDPAYAAVAAVKRRFGVLVHLTDAMPYGEWPTKPRNCARGVVALIGHADASAVPDWARTVPVDI